MKLLTCEPNPLLAYTVLLSNYAPQNNDTFVPRIDDRQGIVTGKNDRKFWGINWRDNSGDDASCAYWSNHAANCFDSQFQ